MSEFGAWSPPGGAKITALDQIDPVVLSDLRGHFESVDPIRVLASQVIGQPEYLERLDTDPTGVSITGSTTEQTAYSFDIPAGLLQTIGAVKLELFGRFLNETGVGQTLRLRVKYGATTIWDATTDSLASSSVTRGVGLSFVLGNLEAVNAQRMAGMVGIGSTINPATAGYGGFGQETGGSDTGSEEIGIPKAWLTGTPPADHILLDGTTKSRTTYSELFDLWGTTFNTGGEAGTDFRLPDMRGRAFFGVGTHTEIDTIGENDGLAVGSRRPKHGSSVTDPGHSHTKTDSGHAHTAPKATTAGGAADRFLPGENGSANLTTNSATTGITYASATTGITVGPTSSAPTDTVPHMACHWVVRYQASSGGATGTGALPFVPIGGESTEDSTQKLALTVTVNLSDGSMFFGKDFAHLIRIAH